MIRIYRSKVSPGFWLRVEWLWEEPLRRSEEVLLEISGERYLGDLVGLVSQAGGERYLGELVRLVAQIGGEDSARAGLVALREALGSEGLRRLLDEVLRGRQEDERG